MPRAEGLDVAPPEDSYVVTSTKLRAETSKIVGCVAEYVQEQAADSGRRQKRAEPTRPGTDNTKASVPICLAVHSLAGYDAEALEGTAIQSRSEPGGRAAGSDLDQDVEKAGAARLKGGTQMDVEVAGLDGLTSSCSSEGQAGRGDGCKACADRADERSISSKNDLDVEHREQHCRWTTLKLPDVPFDSASRGYSAIKQNAEEWLRQIAATRPTTNSDVPDLWSYWETSSDVFEKKYSSDDGRELKSLEPQRQSSESRRLQCDWCEVIKSGEEFLFDESSTLLKKMVRSNAQVLLLKNIAVPNVFEGEWGRELNDSRRSIAAGGEELQQLLLPFDLVREDDAKVTDAPSKLISLADSYFHSLQRCDVSLMKASMNIPSMWNLSVVEDRLADLTTEELRTGEMHQQSHSSTTCRSMQLQMQLVSMASEKGNHFEDESAPTPRRTQLNANKNNSITTQANQPPETVPKLAVATEDSLLSTDYFLSDTFLRCDWSEPPKETDSSNIPVRQHTNSNDSRGDLSYQQLLQQIARPALWDLMRKKLLQVDGTSFQSALNRVRLEALEAIIYQQFRDVKKMSLNPSATSSIEIIEACASLRQAVWLHTLRIVSINQLAAAQNGKMMSAILARIIPSVKYKLVLGPSNWKDLLTFLEAIGERAVPVDAIVEPATNGTISNMREEDLILQPHQKRQRVLHAGKEVTPVRVLCSVDFLEQDDLLDELCTEQHIFFIERDLPSPIDVLVDERNCICVVTGAMLQVEANVRTFVFSLARLQVQLQKCWLVIALDTPPAPEMEDTMTLLFAALVQFRIEIQVLTSFSCEESGRFVRAIVDECAEVALSCHRILPRLWFERPFLLEEESQLERFLVSTKVVNHYAAQSLLHKVSMEDLFSKRIDALKLLVQNAVTEEQLQLLWRLIQQDHGLNGGMQ